MPDLLIRDAHDSDRAAIQNVTLSAYQEYAALMPAHWEDYRHGILATLAEVKPAEQIVAEQAPIVYFTTTLTQPAFRNTLANFSPAPLAFYDIETIYYRTPYR